MDPFVETGWWPVKYQTTVDLATSGEQATFTAGLHTIPTADRVWFAVTAVTFDPTLPDEQQRRRAKHHGTLWRDPVLRAALPDELGPVLALHLADEHGVPFQAASHAAYWFGWSSFKDATVTDDDGRLVRVEMPYLPIVARHLRVSEEQAGRYEEKYRDDLPGLERALKRLRKRWQREADEAVALLLGLGAEDNRTKGDPDGAG